MGSQRMPFSRCRVLNKDGERVFDPDDGYLDNLIRLPKRPAKRAPKPPPQPIIWGRRFIHDGSVLGPLVALSESSGEPVDASA